MIDLNDKLRLEIKTTLEKFKSISSTEGFPQFVAITELAVRHYFEYDEPKIIAKEVKLLVKMCKKPSPEILNLMNKLSDATKIILAEKNILLSLPNPHDPKKLTTFCETIVAGLSTGGKLHSDRVHTNFIGQIKPGPPKQSKVDLMVAFIAGAYIGLTGEKITRQWNLGPEPVFYDILRSIFDILREPSSVEGAIRRFKRDHVFKER